MTYLGLSRDDYSGQLYEVALLASRAAFALFFTVLLIELVKSLSRVVSEKRRYENGRKLIDEALVGSEDVQNRVVAVLNLNTRPIYRVDGNNDQRLLGTMEKLVNDGVVEETKHAGQFRYYKLNADVDFYLGSGGRVSE